MQTIDKLDLARQERPGLEGVVTGDPSGGPDPASQVLAGELEVAGKPDPACLCPGPNECQVTDAGPGEPPADVPDAVPFVAAEQPARMLS